MAYICVGYLTIIGSHNGLSPGWYQAIAWTNAGILLTGTVGINFSEILSEVHTSLFRTMHWKMSSAKWRICCPGLNVLKFILWVAGELCQCHGYWAPSQCKDRLSQGWGLPCYKDKTVGETILSLTWESLYWQDDIFILNQGPGALHYQSNLGIFHYLVLKRFAIMI